MGCKGKIIFYYIGILVKHYGWKQRKIIILVVTYIFAMVFSIIEGVIVNDYLGMFSVAISQLKITTMFCSLVVIALFMNNWNYKHNEVADELYSESREKGMIASNLKLVERMFIYIGDISFGIYFCHMFVLRCVSFALRQVEFNDVFPLPIIQVTQFLLTLIGSVMGIYILQRLDSGRKICPYLGF